jgi:hypothetical protein
MEMLSYAYFTKADDSHDTNIKGEYRSTLLVTRDHGNSKAFGGYSVRFETFGICLSLDIWCPLQYPIMILVDNVHAAEES